LVLPHLTRRKPPNGRLTSIVEPTSLQYLLPLR
jgi:hypothetical protein